MSMWPPSSDTRVLNYGINQHDIGMVGLRDLFVVAPSASFHHTSLSLNDQNLNNPVTTLGVGLGANPLHNTSGSTGLQIWQSRNVNQNVSMMQASGTTTCQDCGNQAKKDCCHRRCRTCCKSRGYECSTHVKSTWVPASRRRERQLLVSSATGGGSEFGSISLSTGSVVKKARLGCSNAATSRTSNSNTPPRSFETTSCHQDASFKETLPGQILAPATFKCVKVTSINDGDDEFAYQAVVRIGGHVFKGFLYDQGEEPVSREHQQQQGLPNLSDLHLGGGSGMHKGSCSTAGLDTPLSDVYGGGSTVGGGTLGGSSYESVHSIDASFTQLLNEVYYVRTMNISYAYLTEKRDD